MSRAYDIIRLDSCVSTSTELATMSDALAGTIVVTDCQTAGRGQRGNTWEAEPGANLTFSLLLRPAEIEAARQFEMSMLVSLAIVDVLDGVLGTRAAVSIKWPNDIYAGNRKMCGILIENSLTGRKIDRAVVGIGLNVNQKEFRSDAPNPVSIVQLTGVEMPLSPLLERLADAILKAVDGYRPHEDSSSLKERYMSRLWRCDGGAYPFVDAVVGERFMASIADVAADGTLTLDSGVLRRYQFKEVVFVL